MGYEGNSLIDGDDGSHPNSPGYTELPDCPECEGRGQTLYSCCGDDITDNIDVTDICPTCYEHCGDELETCSKCDGDGTISREEHKEYHSLD